jgi:hypothetical protein
MKKIVTLVIVLIISFCASAQILCIKCYNQNARVLTDTNNLIVNGGFENTTCNPHYIHNYDSSFCPHSNYYYCDIANWTCTGGGINTYANVTDTSISIIIEGTKAVYFGNANAIACSASYLDTSCLDTSCLSNDGCEVTGIPVGYPKSYMIGYGGDKGVSLSQTVTGLTAGSIYTLDIFPN